MANILLFYFVGFTSILNEMIRENHVNQRFGCKFFVDFRGISIRTQTHVVLCVVCVCERVRVRGGDVNTNNVNILCVFVYK